MELAKIPLSATGRCGVNVKLYKQCAALPLPYKQKYVLRSLASFARGGCRDAYPSVSTIAHDTGLGQTTVRECLRLLEKEQIITPGANTKGGGRGRTTTYFIVPESYKANTRAMPLPEQNPTVLDSKPNTRVCQTQHTCDDDGLRMVKTDGVKATASPSIDPHLQMVWDYYRQEIKDKPYYTLTPQRKKMGETRFTESLSIVGGDPVKAVTLMKCAIDAIRDSAWHNGKNDAKAMYNGWENIFGTQERFQNGLDRSDWD